MSTRRSEWNCKRCGEDYDGETYTDEEIDELLITQLHDCKDGGRGIGVLKGYSAPIDPIEAEFKIAATHPSNGPRWLKLN